MIKILLEIVSLAEDKVEISSINHQQSIYDLNSDDPMREEIRALRKAEALSIRQNTYEQMRQVLKDVPEAELRRLLRSTIYELELMNRKLRKTVAYKDWVIESKNRALVSRREMLERSRKKVDSLNQTAFEMRKKLFANMQARRKGADKIHVENRAMKVAVFEWLRDQNLINKSNEAVGTLITKQQPIAHRTAVDWYKEWKKLQSASTL